MTEPFARERVLAREWVDDHGGEKEFGFVGLAEELARLLARYRDEVMSASGTSSSEAGRTGHRSKGGKQRPGQR